MAARLTAAYSFIGVAVAVVFVAIIGRSAYLFQDRQRLFTVEELALYNGSDDSLPILLGILGDASRAFVSGNFTGDGLTDSLRGLSGIEVRNVMEWREFYSRTYIFAGKLVGRYYDSEGNPTKHLKAVEARAARGAQLLDKQKREEALIPNCNSRWSQDDGGEVWCNEGYPRLVQRPLEVFMSGKMSKRCACIKYEELGRLELDVYDGCDYHAMRCRV